MDADVQFRIHQTVFILWHMSASLTLLHNMFVWSHLSCSVDDFRQKRLAFVDNLMAECVLDRRIVTLDEMAFAILDCQRGFACAGRQSLIRLSEAQATGAPPTESTHRQSDSLGSQSFAV